MGLVAGCGCWVLGPTSDWSLGRLSAITRPKAHSSPSFCFLNIPRQIAGAYPGVDVATYLSLTSEPPADMGQWSYDFSDPEGAQLGTVALPGLASVYDTEDPVALIADHQSLGVPLPDAITDPVDLIVLCDRSRTEFEDRRFLVMELEDRPGVITIGAFETFDGLPAGARILGHVTLVQIPWLPVMTKKRSGFSEEEDLF